MQSFENLIHASAQALSSAFSPLRGKVKGDGEVRRAQLAQLLGMNSAQLTCAIAFNAESIRIPDLPKFLGYPSRDSLLADCNYLFIHDRYRALSVNNIVEIYGALGAGEGKVGSYSDLVISRLNNIEAQLEETINPILIGGYKLEIRAIYENGLTSSSFLNARLDPNYAPLREMTNESMIMVELGVVPPAEFLRHPGLSPDEKARAVFQNLIARETVEQYLADAPTPDVATKLRAAIAGNA